MRNKMTREEFEKRVRSLDGDALSTACFILGEEKSKPLLDEYSACAVFVDKDLNVSTYGDIDFEEVK